MHASLILPLFVCETYSMVVFVVRLPRNPCCDTVAIAQVSYRACTCRGLPHTSPLMTVGRISAKNMLASIHLVSMFGPANRLAEIMAGILKE